MTKVYRWQKSCLKLPLAGKLMQSNHETINFITIYFCAMNQIENKLIPSFLLVTESIDRKKREICGVLRSRDAWLDDGVGSGLHSSQLLSLQRSL